MFRHQFQKLYKNPHPPKNSQPCPNPELILPRNTKKNHETMDTSSPLDDPLLGLSSIHVTPSIPPCSSSSPWPRVNSTLKFLDGSSLAHSAEHNRLERTSSDGNIEEVYNLADITGADLEISPTDRGAVINIYRYQLISKTTSCFCIGGKKPLSSSSTDLGEAEEEPPSGPKPLHSRVRSHIRLSLPPIEDLAVPRSIVRSIRLLSVLKFTEEKNVLV